MTALSPQPCLSFNVPPIALPAIFTPSINAVLTFPPPPTLPDGAIPCCHFTIPSFTLPISLPPLPIGPLLVALNAAITAALANIGSVTLPRCNF